MTTFLLSLSILSAQTDPGPRPGPVGGVGQSVSGMTAGETQMFLAGADVFQEVDSVAGNEPGASGSGLGPRFNMNSCKGCHAHPQVGGSSPPDNPQIDVATRFGANNIVPPFIKPDGPIRVVRFPRGPNGMPDGSVHALFVITGRADAGNCNIPQPDFANAVAQNNAIFRIPTPLFGAGLIEAIPDAAILANRDADRQAKQRMGIGGRENRNGNDGTITRYGWKAQNKSLLIFAGEAYNVEMGVTNELFPNEREDSPGCAVNGTPEDHSHYDAASPVDMLSDTAGFAMFMRFLAPLAPAADTPSIANGRIVFQRIGCALCHTPSLTTGPASSPALTTQQVPLYSDLLLHNMGGNLADGIDQGNARGGDWRTAPLWGLGQRLFFLHDGRTSDLLEAIRAHAGPQSEANGVIGGFDALPPPAKQDLLNFLRSL